MMDGTTSFKLNSEEVIDYTDEQIKKEYWPYLEQQPILSKLLIKEAKSAVSGWYKCDCGSEVLHIEEDKENGTVYLNISIWLMGYQRPTLWQRLKHCWHILRTGQNYADQIILNWNEVTRLHKDLSRIVEGG